MCTLNPKREVNMRDFFYNLANKFEEDPADAASALATYALIGFGAIGGGLWILGAIFGLMWPPILVLSTIGKVAFAYGVAAAGCFFVAFIAMTAAKAFDAPYEVHYIIISVAFIAGIVATAFYHGLLLL